MDDEVTVDGNSRTLDGRVSSDAAERSSDVDAQDQDAPWSQFDSGSWSESDSNEIEGEITRVEVYREAPLDPPPLYRLGVEWSAADQQDPVMVLSVESTTLQVNPGAAVGLRIGLLNNGDHAGLFEVRLEGWVDSSWVAVNPLYRSLEPGERAALNMAIEPPREAKSEAGVRQVIVVMRSSDYPGRESRLSLALEILPYDEIVVGETEPRCVQVTNRQRSANFSVPIVNRGNRPVLVRVRSLADESAIRLWQSVDGQGAIAPFGSEELRLDLSPGQSETLQASIRPHRLPLLRPKVVSSQIVASITDRQQVPRTRVVQTVCYPRLGRRQLRAVVLLAILILAALAALSAAGLGIATLLANLPPPASPTATPAPPAIALIIPIDALISEGAPAAGIDSAEAAPIVDDNSREQVPDTDGAAPDRESSVPIVQANEISAPGSAPPVVVTAVPSGQAPQRPPDTSRLTFEQMFQQIALRYDMDWRLLAAQAYVESKFDTRAVGQDGDLGLMQILPATWHEWAPVADVADPFDAYSNALVAAAYLDYIRAYLGEQGYPQTEWMLVAYNWGPDKVSAFLTDGNRWEELPQSLQEYAGEIQRIADSLAR